VPVCVFKVVTVAPVVEATLMAGKSPKSFVNSSVITYGLPTLSAAQACPAPKVSEMSVTVGRANIAAFTVAMTADSDIRVVVAPRYAMVNVPSHKLLAQVQSTV
jgi:hypothetical protein